MSTTGRVLVAALAAAVVLTAVLIVISAITTHFTVMAPAI